jgi:hypothetical protein
MFVEPFLDLPCNRKVRRALLQAFTRKGFGGLRPNVFYRCSGGGLYQRCHGGAAIVYVAEGFAVAQAEFLRKWD